MSSFVLLIVVSTLTIAAALVLKASERKRLQSSLVCYLVHFPRRLEASAVSEFLVGIRGMLPPWYKRWVSTPFVVLETEGSIAGITHRLLVPRQWARAVEQQLRASIPSLRYELIPTPNPVLSRGAEYSLSSGLRPLRVDASGISAKLLSSLSGFVGSEAAVLQWVLAPTGPPHPVSVAPAKGANLFARIFPKPNTVASSEIAAPARKKQAHPMLLGVCRIGVRAKSEARQKMLLRNTEVGLHGSAAPGAHLRRRMIPDSVAVARIARRATPFVAWPGVFNTEELAGLIGFPIGLDAVPGLTLGGCRELAPSPRIPTSGTVLAEATFPGQARPLALGADALVRHTHVLGPTGTGKSVLLVNMAAQHIAAGLGVIFVDPRGDAIADLLGLIPKHRIADVIVFDPADPDPLGLNPLRAAAGASKEVVVENVVGTIRSLNANSWGPRTDDVMRGSILTLAGVEGATLCEVPLILTDPNYRRRVVSRIDDPVGLESFWGWYESISDAERLNVIGPTLNKLRAWTMRPQVRAVIGQSRPELSMREVLTKGKILLVSLASGLLGEEAADLLGALIVAEIWHATTARAALNRQSRAPVAVFMDEFQRVLRLPTEMPAVLAEARGLGVGVVVAHQNLAQLPPDVREAVLANCRSRVIFQLGSSDAKAMEKEMAGMLTADDLSGLGAFDVVVQPFAAGSTQPPATGRSRPLPPPISEPEEIREASRARYGRPRAEIEAEIRARQLGKRASDPIRRKRSGGTE